MSGDTLAHPFVPVPDRVAMHVARRPRDLAISDRQGAVSYGDLGAWTDRLASHLRSRGVGRGVLVGLFTDRSIEFVAGALAILKAGGAYVPIDPTYPTERTSFMLVDSGAQVVVSDRATAAHVPAGAWQIALVDRAEALASDQAPEPVGTPLAESDLAYVIYTSGSTGRPKGVEITHANLLNLVGWHQAAFAVTAADRATQVASPGFDAAVWELWPYLTAGASVHVIDDQTKLSPERLRDWLLHNAITISFLPTPLAESVLALDWPSRAWLRVLLTGGDVLHQRPRAGLPFKLINNYGPTETTVVATSGEVAPGSQGGGRLPTIGVPISNVHVYILDDAFQPVPVGEVGELYIGGAGVARGYLNRPDLTAERFIDGPFAAARHERVYRTGDLGRWLPDGSIEFLGRIDDQVKIRGFRVETGEIEAVLAEHPSIQTSVVLASHSAAGDTRLTAYVVSANGSRPASADLRAFLAARLPDYMLPSAFICLDTLPLTPNGKVDRAALPEPGACLAERSVEFVAPRTPLEQRLAEIVAGLLEVDLDQVGMEDNFFLLGGHSLLGAQVVVQVQDTFDVELTLQTVFTAPTLSALSAEIEALILEKVEAMSEEDALRLVG